MGNETQETVGTWNVDTFGAASGGGPQHARRVLMEAVELCLAAGMKTKDIYDAAEDICCERDPAGGYKHNPDPEKVPAEAADVLITLWGLAHRRGFDLAAEVDKKMHINRYEREWVLNGDGTAQHIREGSTP